MHASHFKLRGSITGSVGSERKHVKHVKGWEGEEVEGEGVGGRRGGRAPHCLFVCTLAPTTLTTRLARQDRLHNFFIGRCAQDVNSKRFQNHKQSNNVTMQIYSREAT